jgi:hypothetical protein
MAVKKKVVPGLTQRIDPDDFWRMRDAIKDHEAVDEAYRDWIQKWCKEQGIYLNQIKDPLSGRCVMDDGTEKILPKEAINEARDQFATVVKKIRMVDMVVEEIARKYNTYPDLIDPRTGEIRNGQVKVAPCKRKKAKAC